MKVTGSVTKDGKSQEGVLVGFLTSDTKKGSSNATKTDASGKFQVLLKPGNYSVTISKFVDKSGNVPKDSDDPKMDFTQLEAAGKLRQVMPEPYLNATTSPIKVDIPNEGKDLPPFEVK